MINSQDKEAMNLDPDLKPNRNDIFQGRDWRKSKLNKRLKPRLFWTIGFIHKYISREIDMKIER